MIELCDGFQIEVTENCYILTRVLREHTDKNGKLRKDKKVYGYFGTVSRAFKALAEEMIKERLKGTRTDLVGAVRTICECHRKSDELLRQVMERIPEVNGGNEEGHRGLD